MIQFTQKHLVAILKFACFTVFAGRAWQHIVWDAPFRSLLWDESLMSGLIEGLFGIPWEEYATSLAIGNGIQLFINFVGVFYLICAILSLGINENRKVWGKVLLVGAGSLFFLAFLYYKSKNYQVPQFFEYMVQCSAPIFLYLFIFQGFQEKFILWMKIAIAFTFTCHGLYALGWGVPRSGHFVDMVISILHVKEATAITFLNAAGILDIVVSIGIFLPRGVQIFLAYAALWGFATAIARIWAHVEFDFLWAGLNQWTPEMVYRLPHGLIPLVAFGLVGLTPSESERESSENTYAYQ